MWGRVEPIPVYSVLYPMKSPEADMIRNTIYDSEKFPTVRRLNRSRKYIMKLINLSS